MWIFLSLRKEKKYVEFYWKDVKVGNFVKLHCDEVIPADMVLLHSSDPDGICHIETSSLDGETNLKQRQVVKGCVTVISTHCFVYLIHLLCFYDDDRFTLLSSAYLVQHFLDIQRCLLLGKYFI